MTKISLYPSVTLPLRGGDLFDVSENTGVGTYETKRVLLSNLAPNLIDFNGGYSNATSGLTATSVQDAIDELDSDLDSLTTAVGLLPTVNLYTGNGSLTGTRTVTLGANPLIFTPSTTASGLAINTTVTYGQSLLNVVGFTGHTSAAYFERGNASTAALNASGGSGTAIFCGSDSGVNAFNIATGNGIVNNGRFDVGGAAFGRLCSKVTAGSFSNVAIYGENDSSNDTATALYGYVNGSASTNNALIVTAGSATNPRAIWAQEGNVYLNTGLVTAKARTLIGGAATDAITARLVVKEIDSSVAIYQAKNAAGTVVFEVKYDGTDYGIYLNGAQVL